MHLPDSLPPLQELLHGGPEDHAVRLRRNARRQTLPPNPILRCGPDLDFYGDHGDGEEHRGAAEQRPEFQPEEDFEGCERDA